MAPIYHPSHEHPLSLLPSSPYPSGTFKCDACYRECTGSLYHCRGCNFDLCVSCGFSGATGFTSNQRWTVPVQLSQPRHQFPSPGHSQQTRPVQNHNTYPRRPQQPWTRRPAPTGNNFAANEQNPNYYAMNNNPGFGAPALGVQRANIQNPPGRSHRSSMSRDFYHGMREEVGKKFVGLFSGGGGGGGGSLNSGGESSCSEDEPLSDGGDGGAADDSCGEDGSGGGGGADSMPNLFSSGGGGDGYDTPYGGGGGGDGYDPTYGGGGGDGYDPTYGGGGEESSYGDGDGYDPTYGGGGEPSYGGGDGYDPTYGGGGADDPNGGEDGF